MSQTLGVTYVVCPICSKSYKLLSTPHLKTHGYNSKEEFLKDYPSTMMVSQEYSKRRSQILGKVNQSDIMRSKASANAKKLNQDSYRQSLKGSKGWTPERRMSKSLQMKQVLQTINESPEYRDFRARRLAGFSYGKVHKYTTQSGHVLRLKSFTECSTAKFLEYNNYEFEYESLEIEYTHPIDQRIHKYYPDFYLPNYNLILEVKAEDKLQDAVVLAKMLAAKSCGYNFMFITSSDLKRYKLLIDKINALRIE